MELNRPPPPWRGPIATLHYLGKSIGGELEASSTILDIHEPGLRFLVDSGTMTKNRQIVPPRNSPLKVGPKIDASFASHWHYDHIGNFPANERFQKSGAPLFVGAQTYEEMPFAFWDNLEFNPYYFGKKRGGILARTNVLARCRIITPGMHSFRGVPFCIIPNGHAPGSFGVCFKIPPTGKNVLFWTDNCRHDQPVVRGAKPFSEMIREGSVPRDMAPDVVAQIDLTSGSLIEKSYTEEFGKLKSVIIDTIKRGGKVIIAAFARGRGQNLAIMIRDAMERGELPRVRVFLDGAISRILEALKKTKWSDLDITDFETEGLHYVPSDVAEATRNEIIFSTEPVIIITTAGMGDGGPFKQYAEFLLENEKNSFVSVSWLSDDSLFMSIRKAGEKQESIEFTMDAPGKPPRQVIRKVIANIHGFSFSAHSALPWTREFLADIVEIREGRKLEFLGITHGTAETKRLVTDRSNDLTDITRFAERWVVTPTKKRINIW